MNKKHVDLSEFLSIIAHHHRLEDRELYRWIDEKIDDENQSLILKNI